MHFLVGLYHANSQPPKISLRPAMEACLQRAPRPPARQPSQPHRCRPRLLCRAVRTPCTLPPPPTLTQALNASNERWLDAALRNRLQLGSPPRDASVVLLGVQFWAPQQHELVEAALQQVQPTHILLERPPATTHPGGVGRDLIDAFESFGYYSGLDFVRGGQPGGVATDVQRLCGFLPGAELEAAAEHASSSGVELSCIDAPVKLQQAWVQKLLESFHGQLAAAEQLDTFVPQRDFEANQALAAQLPSQEWDQQLAAAADELQQQQHASADTQRQALLLFKVSKATAAALLPPDEAQQAEVLARMRRLQPLKWGHFEMRASHMAQRIKEAATAAARAAGSGSKQKPPMLLAVVGRQHVSAISALWHDRGSQLWRSEVPRGFAASMLEGPPSAAGAE